LEPLFDHCWKVEYGVNGTSVTYKIEDVYKGWIENMVKDIEKGLVKDHGVFAGSFFDSVIMKVEVEKSDYATTIAQNKLNFDCIKTAISSPGSSCKKTVNVATFKLNENYVQNLFMVKQRENKIKEM